MSASQRALDTFHTDDVLKMPVIIAGLLYFLPVIVVRWRCDATVCVRCGRFASLLLNCGVESHPRLNPVSTSMTPAGLICMLDWFRPESQLCATPTPASPREHLGVSARKPRPVRTAHPSGPQ